MSFGSFNNPVFNAVPFNGPAPVELGINPLAIDDQSFSATWVNDRKTEGATWIDDRKIPLE